MAADLSNRSPRHREPPLASPPTSFTLGTRPQNQCPLFSLLPAELRLIIFRYTLTDYESSGYFYSPDDRNINIDIRHDFRPRRSTCTQLLRTCQRIYSETWLMPFIFAEHIFYVGARIQGTNEDTRRDKTISQQRMTAYLRTLKDYASTHDPTFHIPQIDHIRYYFHPSGPGPAFPLFIWTKFVSEELGPKCLTFSVSYKNSWMKHVFGYNLRAGWFNNTRFPRTVTRIRVELGKFSNDPPLRQIVSEVISQWYFRREDGVVFRADVDDVVYRRCVVNRVSRNGVLLTEKVYTMPMVTWKPVDGFDPFADGYECPDLDLTSLAKQLDRAPLGDITRSINRLTAHG